MRLKKISHFFGEIQTANIQRVHSSLLKQHKISLDVKRDDCLHPIVSGNKWRKLKYLLLNIEAKGFKKVAAMGGTHSNFLHALAYLGYRMNWSVTLYVRGYAEQTLSPMLQDAINWGAKIIFVDRIHFRQLRESSPELSEDTFWIAEGGSHSLALKGVSEMLMEGVAGYDFIIMATATGTTLAGISLGLAQLKSSHCKVLGVAVLNNASQIEKDIDSFLGKKVIKPQLITGYEFGGYAKSSLLLNQFIDDFEFNSRIPLEPIYSGKSFFAVFDLIQKNYFPINSRILLIHCGGLQGRR